MTLGQRVSAITLLLVAVSGGAAYAAALSVEASDNATVQVAGPRSGTSGKSFFNVEGSNNGNFASYGVADFNFGVLGNSVISINSISLSLVQSNAAFSTSGDVIISLDKSAVLVDIQPVTSPLKFAPPDPGTATDVADGDINLLSLGAGPYTYTVGVNGDVNTYVLALDATSTAELISRLNSAATIRIVLGTGANNVAATWAGNTNTTLAGPTLNLDVEYDTGVPTAPVSWGKIKAQYR